MDPSTLSPGRSRAADIAERIVDRLEEDIVVGLLRPNERLVEDDLMSRFDTKRHIIRQALAKLDDMGLVVRVPNKGAAVRSFTPQEVRQIYSVREALETTAIEQLPLPASPRLLQALEKIQAAHDKAVESRDLRRVFRSNLDFHRTLFGACENKFLVEAIEDFAQRTHGVRFYAVTNMELLRGVANEHRQIISALADNDRDRLLILCREHLRPAQDAYIDAYSHSYPE